MEDFLFKVVIFGDGGVGKSTLVNRYLTGTFDENQKLTIGVEFHIKRLEIENCRVTLQLWDFAGEYRFRMLLPNYVRGASGGIFMYDITRYSSLKNLDPWLECVKTSRRDLSLIMIGSKLDLHEDRSVSTEVAKEVANQNGFFGYAECSSKTGHFVEEIFELLTRTILEQHGHI